MNYSSLVQTHPRITNAITTGSLFGIGDAIAQLGFEPKPFDFKRNARSVIYGSVIFAFIGDKWYKLLSRVKFPGPQSGNARVNKLADTITRVAVDQLIWAPIGIPLYFTCMSFMEGKNLADTKVKLQEHWWDTLRTNWIVWPTFQMVNFSIIPVQHQLLSVNVISIFWNTYLSMTNANKLEKDKKPVFYPPVPE